MENRIKSVDDFWKNGVLNPESNVQFGERGAGTFSDGKLNTMVKDPYGRIRKVLEIFVEHGASEDTLYLKRPHIGSDMLPLIAASMRKEIESLGGEFRFQTEVKSILIENGTAVGVCTAENEKIFEGKASYNLLPGYWHGYRAYVKVNGEYSLSTTTKWFYVENTCKEYNYQVDNGSVFRIIGKT
jgi:hypothetical protein